jgi:ABC-type sugar transport system ATPase subunit
VALVAALLSLRGVGKRFGPVRALEGIDLDIHPREVIGICGDNGAGKSTLIRIIAGAEAPSEGTVMLNGAPARFRSPADALARGIATTYQDLALAPRLSIAENVFMGGEITRGPGWLGLLDRHAMRAEAAGYLERFGFAGIDMDSPVADLSGGQRQAVALARALRWRARVVIMDEPTAALGVAESRMVLDLIGRLRAEGVTVILVSHDMDDVVAATSRIVVLKKGRKAGEIETARIDARGLGAAIMSGMVPETPPAAPFPDDEMEDEHSG